jgi:hypothetical protein
MILKLQPVFHAHAGFSAVASADQNSQSDKVSNAEGLDTKELDFQYLPFKNLMKHIDRIAVTNPREALSLAQSALLNRRFTVPEQVEKLTQKLSELVNEHYPENGLALFFSRSALDVTPTPVQKAEPSPFIRPFPRPDMPFSH